MSGDSCIAWRIDSAALSNSLTHTTAEKAYIANGSDVQGTIQPTQSTPPKFAYPVTKVEFANQGLFVNDQDTPADVMVVDPATLVSTLTTGGSTKADQAAACKGLA